MIIAKVQVSGTRCTVAQVSDIPRGLVGAAVGIEYTDSVWDGLTKTVVFRGCVTKDVLNAGSEVTIPAEVVSRAGGRLYMGVYGVDAENNLVIPTIWAELGLIHGAAAPSGDISTDATLPVWAQLQAMIGDLDKLDTTAKSSLVEAVNEALTKGGGTVSPAAVQKIVDDYLKANPPGAGADGKDGITPSIGDNGNWYLGETDTGKPSRGTKGDTGSTGPKGADGVTPNIQIGTVTTLPAGSDATASMGGTTENPLLNLGIPKGADGQGGGSGGGASGGDWELINEIEMSEAASLVTIDKDKDGNPFTLRRVKMECTIVLDTDDPFTQVKTNLNSRIAINNAQPKSASKTPRYYSFYAEHIPGAGVFAWHDCSGERANWSSQIQQMGHKYSDLYQAAGITSLTIVPNDGSKNFGLAGTTIRLVGVRA